MFFEVRILDPKGKMKKLLSSRELSKRHWRTFENSIPFKIRDKINEKTSKFKAKQIA